MTGLIKPELVVSKLRHFIVFLFFFLKVYTHERNKSNRTRAYTEKNILYALYYDKYNDLNFIGINIANTLHYSILYCCNTKILWLLYNLLLCIILRSLCKPIAIPSRVNRPIHDVMFAAPERPGSHGTWSEWSW